MSENQITTEQKIDEFLAPAGVRLTSTHIQVGDLLARTLFISTFPRYVHTNWFSPIINLDRRFDVAVFVHPKDSGIVLKSLRNKLGKLEAQAMEENAGGNVRDPILETAISDIEGLRDRLQQGTERLFELGVYITIYGKDERELNEVENIVRGILEGQMVYMKKATFRMEEGFKSTLPLGRDLLSIHTSANTEPISSIFPFVSHDLTSNSGILYGINLHNSSLVLFDRFDRSQMENANAVLFGKSGGGKSYAVKLEILRSMLFGTQVFVIDPENEYKFLSDSVGGTSVNVSVSSDNHINPFDVPVPQADETFEDVLRSHISALVGLFKLMLGSLTPEEDSVLDEAIRQTYASKDITSTSQIDQITPPLMSDLQDILEGMEGGKSLLIRIKKYTEGTFSGFLNKPTNVRLDNQLIVFSIRDMEEELRPIAMYLVLNHIWTQIRRELRKRILVVDEAWWLMKYPFGGDFLFSVAKRARKYYLGLTTISQDVADFMTAEKGKAIITNSSLQMLLKQSPASIDVVQKTFNLTDTEKYFLLDAKEGHGLFFAGRNHIALWIRASYAEHQIITSDPRELLEVQRAKEELARPTTEPVETGE
ncbi:MAG: ATP-binding protein [Parcubacteria group bacterium]